uniref:Quattro n=1 Tax=Oreochromis aureus TaxID=47969 RepID=A0A668SZ75_OREAU
MTNPESLDSSIQSVLSALFPPFEATAPIVLCQLFRTIEERYHGDALQCLLDFLIPSKHVLESVQQAACAGYSDVVFRCEGWPLCLHDKTVIQLAPVNPLLLRPGDFYLQVEPFGEQAARIVLKCLLEEGCREVEETPIPETSYPCIFTEDWLRDINEGRDGTPLSRCLLCTDQGVIKLPWAKIAIPEFLDKPKIMPTCQKSRPEPKQISVPVHFNSSTLPVEATILSANDRMSASLRPAACSSKLVKMEDKRGAPKSCSKPLIKPVGWVSPNTWDSHNYQEIEGDYVDLVDIDKGKELVDKQRDRLPNPTNSVLFKPVRPPPPVPLGNSVPCGRTLQYTEERFTPCSQENLGQELTDEDLKCRYRDSYLAALTNPVPFEKGSVDLLAALEEVGLTEDGELKSKAKIGAQKDQVGNDCNHSKEPVFGNEPFPCKRCHEPTPANFKPHLSSKCEPENLMKESPIILKSTPGLSQSQRVQTKLISHPSGHSAFMHPVSDVSSGTPDGDLESHQRGKDVKPSGKHKVKVRSLSAVSETPTGRPLLYKLNNRSHSDICPETVTNLMHCKKEVQLDEETLKLETEKSSSPSCPSTGSRDKTGRAVVEVHGERMGWTSPLVSAQSICELLLYLHSIPRYNVRELGMTLVINARKKPPPLHLYKALLMAQEQALHAVHSIVMLMDKDTCPRPEKQPGLQMDLVTTMKALNKTVEASQLTSDFGGTFTYSHTEWLQFRQRLVSFMTDLRGADSLLQKAIKRVDNRNQMDTAQEVQQCIEEQRISMKEMLEDARLVTLQREGGAFLARMKKEEFRFPQSEDYRDALESVTSLYNQVEEKLHTLVMRSNESLQQLEFLFRLREMEAKISTVRLVILQNALILAAEAEAVFESSDSSPARDVFQTLVNTFRSNVEDFMLRAEQRYKELDALVHVYAFCEKASALAKECSHSLEQVEQGCYPAQTLSTLQMYEQRLGGEFSTPHFQAVKAKACALGSGASAAMRVWNAAWAQCREVRQHLKEMQKKKKNIDKNQIQKTTAAKSPGEHGEMEKEGKGSVIAEAEHSLTPQLSTSVARLNCNDFKESKNKESKELHLPEIPDKNGENTSDFSLNTDSRQESKLRPREHHSETDLRDVNSTKGSEDFPSHQPLSRSLSEGSHVCSYLTSIPGFSPLNVSHKHCHSRTQSLEQNQQSIQNRPFPHNKRLRPGNLISKSPRDSNEGKGEGCFISCMWNRKVRRIMVELLSTEREYVKALGYVREHYFPELERADVPQDLRGQRGSIFGNLEKLHDFHRHYFLNELEGCVNEPFRIGRCFLRHRESFALYALYSKNKPQSDSLLINHGQAFFKQKQLKLGDKMDLWSYLLKPVQRISKYSLLLQDMVRECDPGQIREIAELKAALEVIHFQLRHGNNLLAMDAIHHCDVNLKEQGQLIRQDEFLVTFRKKKCFRHIFLFQELILFSKTRKTDIGNDTYIYKQSFKTSDIGMTQNTGDTGLCFEIWFRKRKSQDTYTLQAASREVKEAWARDLERILWEQAIHNREVRLQERVFLGIGNKPFMDIQPSEAAINDRAIDYVLMGRGEYLMFLNKSLSAIFRNFLSPLCSSGRNLSLDITDGRLGSFLSSTNHARTMLTKKLFFVSVDSSESSGESVSGFSSSSHSYHSAIGGEVEDHSPVITVKESVIAQPTEASSILAGTTKKTQPPVPPKPKHKPKDQSKNLPGSKVQYKSE